MLQKPINLFTYLNKISGVRKLKIDGHIHTPFCPHGSADSFELYIEKAIANNFDSISFTEHAPLPISFVDPTPDKDSGMNEKHLSLYIQQLNELKMKYKSQIDIKIGLEVDYIVGFEKQTKDFLNEIGPMLDDSILSVHFLKLNNSYTCIDYSKEVYLQFAKNIGSIQAMYDLYYDTVLQSIHADLGPFKPKRIGHPTLIHKFQLAHNEKMDDTARIQQLLLEIQRCGLQLDFNSAGLSKEYCRESYPHTQFLSYIKQIGLPFIFGSDAHTASDLHQHYAIVCK